MKPKLTYLALRPHFAPLVLDGRKTQTRRMINLIASNVLSQEQRKLRWEFNTALARAGDVGSMVASLVGKSSGIVNQQISVPARHPDDSQIPWEDCGYERIYCPYGQPGDQLCFLTTWAAGEILDHRKPKDLPSDCRIWTAFDGSKPDWCGKSRPGRFMPLELRHLLPRFELKEVRVQRLHDIGRDGRKAVDVLAEGVSYEAIQREEKWFHPDDAPAIAYSRLWIDINGPGSWESNPWVWALSFSRLTPSPQGER